MLDSVSRSISSNAYKETNNNFKKIVLVDIQSDPFEPESIVNSLASIEGPLDVYTWYEGPHILSKSGASFLKENLLEPLYKSKSNAKLFLYSLEAWNFQRNVESMNKTTAKGNLLNSINKVFIECIYASSFFNFCTQYHQNSPLYRFLDKELPKKKWLIDLSAKKDPQGKTVDELFMQKTTLVDCIKELDVKKSYSTLQYLEGYYLIREAILRGIEQNKQKIQVAFVLPNDEAKYYKDYPDELEKILRAEFGQNLNDRQIIVYFRFYNYGTNSSSRPYLGPIIKGLNVRDSDIKNYFNYISANQKV